MVLEDRLFRKKLAGEKELKDLYTKRGGVLRGLGELANTSRTLPACDEDKFSVSRSEPESQEALLQQESRYFPDINDGVRVNIAPLQKAGLFAADVINKKDVDKAIADRAQWRADERRWCREGKLPQPGWWPES